MVFKDSFFQWDNVFVSLLIYMYMAVLKEFKATKGLTLKSEDTQDHGQQHDMKDKWSI